MGRGGGTCTPLTEPHHNDKIITCPVTKKAFIHVSIACPVEKGVILGAYLSDRGGYRSDNPPPLSEFFKVNQTFAKHVITIIKRHIFDIWGGWQASWPGRTLACKCSFSEQMLMRKYFLGASKYSFFGYP